MGKLSRLTSGKHVTAGTQIVKTMSTENHHGNAAKLLKEIAKSSGGSRTLRAFPQEWEQNNGVLVKRGMVKFRDRDFPLTVKIGTSQLEQDDELVLKDVKGVRCSMRPANGRMVLEVGDGILAKRLESLAAQMVGSWIVHGRNWRDRNETLFRDPWGATQRGMYEQFFFEIVDGAEVRPRPTLAKLIELGCRRSTHVGEWFRRHSTIIPAVVGMPMTIHEFKKDGGADICNFNGLEIGTSPEIWGPYCSWNEEVRHSGRLGMWQELALRCATPFNFQVHATRTLFPGIQLDSDYLLQSVGHEKLRGILEVMVAHQPGRFYRIIDEKGFTYRQNGVSDNLMQYGEYGVFSRAQAVENVMQTFLELQLIQADPTHAMMRRPRLVIDSHAYIVMEALVRGQKVIHELSGRYMHKYLTDGSDAKMHRVRNEELFLLIRSFFGVQSLKFYIYPPLTYNSGLNSQYDANLRHCKKEDWLKMEVK